MNSPSVNFTRLSKLEVPPPPSVQSPLCYEALGNFCRNMNFALGPPTLIEIACLHAYSIGRAEIKSGAAYPDDLEQASESDDLDKFSAEFVPEMHENLRRHLKGLWLTERTEFFASREEKIHRLFKQTTKGVCILAWTAAEVFLGDVHRGIRKDHPGKYKHLETKKYYFKARDKFQRAFEDLGPIGSKLHNCVMSERLLGLSIIRHALVHRGAVDTGFISDLSEADVPLLNARYPSPNEGDDLRVDAPFAADLIDSVISVCYEIGVELDEVARLIP